MSRIQFTNEVVMEERLIEILTMGESQWTFAPEINNEEKLNQNFRDILEKNNKDVLQDVPLTDLEFQQVLNQLNFPTFFDAGKFLVGENGIARVKVSREDANLGTIHLMVFKRQDVAGGSSVYQVIRQYRSRKRNVMGQDARFDVTLLINGLPLIQLELKNYRNPFKDAFHQIKGYEENHHYQGLFSCVQMFVVSNGAETRYIAATSHDRMNEKFLIRWSDEKNTPVNDLYLFAENVLSIPAAHKMISHYSVLDDQAKNVILLRPYQIHAIEAVQRAAQEGKPGYVWHTTGSGKTLTSYKASRNLYQIPRIEKTIFIVDRVDLDQQTTNSFISYAENDTIEIDATSDVRNLKKNLLSKDRNVVVTTIQKLNYLMKHQKRRLSERDTERLQKMNVAFVVDECHRAVTSEKQKDIQDFFLHSLWYGFTGTPIFAENKKDVLGNLPSTTEGQYENRLHEYTVREAIGDGAVLGFKVENRTTLDEDALREIVEHHTGKDPDDMTNTELEENIPPAYFQNEAHRLQVIDYIINQCDKKLALDNERGKSYGAILTTPSIAEAQAYYDLFQSVKRGEKSVKVSDKIKSLLYDFPKVAMTYSISENQEMTSQNKEKMVEALMDYNEEYGTHFTLETIRSYNQNLNERLARKKSLYQNRSEQVDLVIVVDRLLTGFDAPSLGILFIDRKPMSYHSLIQAFSRTNRLFDHRKKYGQIVTFRQPYLFDKKIEEAFRLYSNGGENFVTAPPYDVMLEIYKKAYKELRRVASSPKATDSYVTVKEKADFVKAFQNYDRAKASIEVYDEYREDETLRDYMMTNEEEQGYHGRYVNILAELRESEDIDIPDLLDVHYVPISVTTTYIDYAYLIRLMQDKADHGEDFSDKKEKELEKIIEEMLKLNRVRGQIYMDVYEDMKANPRAFAGIDIEKHVEDIIESIVDEKMQAFARIYKVDLKDVAFYAAHYKVGNKDKQMGENALLASSKIEAYRSELNPDEAKNFKKVHYNRRIVKDLNEMVEKEILPYFQG